MKKWINKIPKKETSFEKETLQNTKDHRFLLCFILFLIMSIDIASALILVLRESSTEVFIIPCLLAAVDAVFLAVSIRMNFRYKYSLYHLLLFLVSSFALTAIFCGIFSWKKTYISMSWIASVHFVTIQASKIVLIALLAVYAKRREKKAPKLAGFCMIISAVCLVVGYSVFIGISGIMGQDIAWQAKECTLVFEERDGGYYVVGTLCDGNTIDVPEEFNGKKVTGIDVKVFEDAEIASITLHNGNQFFCNFAGLSEGRRATLLSKEVPVRLYAPKTCYNDIRSSLFSYTFGDEKDSVAKYLYTVIEPTEDSLEKGENYFNIELAEEDLSSLPSPKYIETVFTKNTELTFQDIVYSQSIEVGYLDHADKKNYDDLYWVMRNNKGLILKRDEALQVVGGVTTLEFEPVYKLVYKNGNDGSFRDEDEQKDWYREKYNLQKNQSCDWLFAKSDLADAFSLTREGFDVVYRTEGNVCSATEWKVFDDLESNYGVLNAYAVSTTWTLKKPSVERLADATVTYGDGNSITVAATLDADSASFAKLQYSLDGITYRDSNVFDEEFFRKSQPINETQGGETVTVYVRAADGGKGTTDLTSDVVSTSFLYTICRKTVTLAWSTLTERELIYSASPKVLTCEATDLCSFGGKEDECDVRVSLADTETGAGDNVHIGSFRYTADSLSNDNYKLPKDVYSVTYTVTPFEVRLDWSSFTAQELVYSGTNKTMTAWATNLFNGDSCNVRVSCTNGKDDKNVGSFSYTANSLDNKDYVLPENVDSPSYTITKKNLVVTAKDYSLTYGDNPPDYGVKYDGFVENETEDVLTVKPTATSLYTKETEVAYTGIETAADGGIDENYSFTYVKGSILIARKSLTVQAGDQTIVYGDAPTHGGVSFDGFVNGQSEGNLIGLLSYSYDYSRYGDIGNYYIYPTGYSADNYALSFQKGNLTVLAKEVDLVWTTLSISDLIYNGEKKMLSASVKAGYLVNSDTCVVESSVTTGKDNKNVGTFTFTATKLTNGNYALPKDTVSTENVTSASYDITPKEVSLTWNLDTGKGTTDLVYAGTEKYVKATAEGLVAGDECPVVVSLKTGDNVHVGKPFTFEATKVNNENYKLPASVVSEVYTITQREIVILWKLQSANLIYSGTEKVLSASVKNICSGDTCDIVVQKTAFTDNVNVGSGFSYEATSINNDDYVLPTVVKSLVQQIEPKEIVIVWVQDNFTYTGAAQQGEVTASYRDIENAPIALTTSVSGDFKNYLSQGYVFNASFTYGETNYKMPASTTKTYHIKKADYDMSGITFQDAKAEYDGNAHQTEITGTLPTGADGVQVTVSYTGSATKVAEGSVTVTAVFATESNNYNTPSVKKASITVEKKEVGLSWSTLTAPELVYNGKSKKLTATATSLCGSDKCYVSVALTQGKDNIHAGAFTFTATELTGTDAGNYKLPADVESDSFVITKKELTVTAKSYTVTYGDKAPTYDVQYSGFENGETASVLSVKPTATSDYTQTSGVSESGLATIASGGDDDDYSFTYLDGSVTINKKALTITAKAHSVLYGDYPANNGVAYSGFVNGEDESDLSDSLSFDYNYSRYGNIGSYEIVPSGYTSLNYAITFKKGTLTVKPKEVDISWNGLEEAYLVYNGTAKIATATVAGGYLVNDDICQVTTQVTAQNDNVHVGKFTFTAVELSNKNYSLPNSAVATTNLVSGQYTITAKEVSLSWSFNGEKGTGDLVYSGKDKYLKAQAGGLVLGDVCTVTVGLKSGDNRHVGTPFTFAATALSNKNYKLPDDTESSVQTILAKEIDLKWSLVSENLTFSGQEKVLKATATGLVGSDVCVVTVQKTMGTDNVHVGSFTYEATSVNNADYVLPSKTVSDAQTIVPKEITISWVANDFTYTGADQKSSVTASYTDVEGFSIDLQTSVTGEFKNYKGTGYVFTASFANAESDYKMPTTVTKTYMMKKADYDMSGITFTSASVPYDGNYHQLVVSGTLPTGEDGIQVTVSYSGGATDVSEGAVTVTAKFATTSTNYHTPSPMTAKITIVAKEASLLWSTLSASDLVYSGTAKVLTATVDNRCTEDVCFVLVSVTSGQNNINVGSFTFTATELYGTDASNYVLPSVKTSASYTITKKTLTVTAKSYTVTYGDAVPTYGVDYAGFVNGETASVLTTKPTATSSYTKTTSVTNSGLSVTASGGVDENYSFQYKSGTVTIQKKALTVKANAKTITYGDSPANAGVSYTGFVNGETKSNLSGTLGYSYTYKQYQDVGKYDIVPSGYTSSNYAITYTKGVLTVEAKTVQLSWKNLTAAELKYDGKEKVVTASVASGSLVNGDLCTVTVALTEGEDNVNVGTFTYTATGLSNKNYALPANVVSGTYEIKK